jgi:hypothetical protein
MVKPSYFNEENRQESFKLALKFFREYEKIPNRKELRSYLELTNTTIDDEEFDDLVDDDEDLQNKIDNIEESVKRVINFYINK